ncbi:trypsin-like peptidase domain-containing protein [Streptomyces sp. NPDC048644]|uniref:trypsin-like peptidase domain-containing protein n=1 Tax=Streptomyces sp. NPDC048644 TaxID=3365582 RepID=UPI00371A93EC
MALLDADADRALVRIRDLAGRSRGTGFLADQHGTILTSHEAVDGLARIVVQPLREGGLGGRGFDGGCTVDAADVTPLPGSDLALVRSRGFGLPPLTPLPVSSRPAAVGTRVRLWAGGWFDGQVTAVGCQVTYTATDRFHLLDAVGELELCVGGREALRLGGAAAGGPVLDARTGALLGVLGTALQAGRPADGFAVLLRAAAATEPGGPLAALLARNAATVPAYGSELNLAGALQLTATSVGSAGRPRLWREPVERPDVVREFEAFGALRAAGTSEADGADSAAEVPDVERADGAGPLVLALVGEPGSGRTTELAALAARRAQGAAPAPTVWLRGADLHAGDDGVRTAVRRALHAAGRIIGASGRTAGDPGEATPDGVARLAGAAGRPLLLLLDGPEEMPPALGSWSADWAAATAGWLRASGTRLVIACRPEYWEAAGALFPPALLHRTGRAYALPPGAPGGPLPACVRLGDLPACEAAHARRRYGLAEGAQAAADAGHPLTLRLLAEVRAALPKGDGVCECDAGGADGMGMVVPEAGGPEPEAGGVPDRHAVFGAYLDLLCLRIAVRIAAGRRPVPRGGAVRRLAAQVAGQVHEAARRCLGPGQGELDGASFDEVFPWGPGWASAVLTEGLLVPAGAGYRFAHEEFAEWLQGAHLDVDAALYVLVHRARGASGEAERSARLPSWGGRERGGSGDGASPDAEAGRAARAFQVPGCRIGPVVQALLLLARREGTPQLTRRLAHLVSVAVADGGPAGRHADARWWASHLLSEVLLRVPDVAPYAGVLRLLADRLTDRSVRLGGFGRTGLDALGPWFWHRLDLADADRMDLLRRLLPADGPPRPGAAAGAALAAGAVRRPADGGAGTGTGRVRRQRSAPEAETDTARDTAREAERPVGPTVSDVGVAVAAVGAAVRDTAGDGAAPRGEPGDGAAHAGASGGGRPMADEWSASRSWRRARPFARPPRVRVHLADAPGTPDGFGWADAVPTPDAYGPRDEDAGRGAGSQAAAAEPVAGPVRGAASEAAAGAGGASVAKAVPEPLGARSMHPQLPAHKAEFGADGSGATGATGATGASGATGSRSVADALDAPGADPDSNSRPTGGSYGGAGHPAGPAETCSGDEAAGAGPSDGASRAGAGAGSGGVGGPYVARVRAHVARPLRFLDVAAALLRAEPERMQPLLCEWFDDVSPLQQSPHVVPGGGPPGEITVSAAAQALLYAHRRRALDALADTLADSTHPRADELLATLAEDEPSAMCRAVARWSQDECSERRRAAAAYAPRLAPGATADTDRIRLRQAALALLTRPDDSAHHGAALALLMADGTTRAQFLDRALLRFADGDPQLPAAVFTDALATHPGPVLAAFRTRLLTGEPAGRAAGPGGSPGAVLDTLAECGLPVSAGAPEPAAAVPSARPPGSPVPPGLAQCVAALVREYAERHPERAAGAVAAFVGRRLDGGPAARAALRPLVVELLTRHAVPVRCALASVLVAEGSGDAVALRRELLEVLLAHEAGSVGRASQGMPDTRVLEALLRAVADGAEGRPDDRTREWVRRIGLLLSGTPEGAACFDRWLAGAGRLVPGFARRMREWVAAEPGEWEALVGPGARAALAGCRS